MTKPKHSPGPWTGGNEAVNDANGKLLAYVYYEGFSGNIPPEEGHANSALMAAAPELLFALEKCRDALIRYLTGSETKLWEITEANAAINKAKGRTKP